MSFSALPVYHVPDNDSSTVELMTAAAPHPGSADCIDRLEPDHLGAVEWVVFRPFSGVQLDGDCRTRIGRFSITGTVDI